MTVNQPLVYLLVQVCFLGLVEGNASKTITVTNVVQKNEHNINSVSVLNPDGRFADDVTTTKVGNGIRITAPSKNYTAIISAEGQKDRYYNLDMQCPGNQATCDLAPTTIQTKTEDNVLSFVLSFTGGPDNGFDADIKIIGFRADWEAMNGCQIIDPSQTYYSDMLNCEGGWFSKFRRSENNGYTYEKKVMLTMLNNYEKGLKSYALLIRSTDPDVQNIKVASNTYHFDDYELKTVLASDGSMDKPNFGNRWYHLMGCIQFPTTNFQYDIKLIKYADMGDLEINGMYDGPLTTSDLGKISSLCSAGIANLTASN